MVIDNLDVDRAGRLEREEREPRPRIRTFKAGNRLSRDDARARQRIDTAIA
jgi:hypothetical protein